MNSMEKDPDLDIPPELLEAWNANPAIVKYGDPVLRQVAQPVKRVTRDTQELIRLMDKTMREANGLGLAAPQIGVSERVLVYDSGDGLRTLINPQILSMRGEQFDPPEGCLSIPGLQGRVKRAMEIKIKGFDDRNRVVVKKVTGLEARVIQHEIDHLDGILFLDRAEPETLEWVWGDEDEDREAAA
jgi:peptide deformylase